MQAIKYRKLTLHDFNKWNTVRTEALDHAPEAFGRTNSEEGPRRKEIFSNNIGRNDRFILGAFSRETLVGIAGLFQIEAIKSAHKCMIWSVFVKPLMHGQGIGKELMQRTIELGRGIRGVEMILIGVEANNSVAKGLYKSLGFVEYGKEPHSLKIDGKY